MNTRLHIEYPGRSREDDWNNNEDIWTIAATTLLSIKDKIYLYYMLFIICFPSISIKYQHQITFTTPWQKP